MKSNVVEISSKTKTHSLSSFTVALQKLVFGNFLRIMERNIF